MQITRIVKALCKEHGEIYPTTPDLVLYESGLIKGGDVTSFRSEPTVNLSTTSFLHESGGEITDVRLVLETCFYLVLYTRVVDFCCYGTALSRVRSNS